MTAPKAQRAHRGTPREKVRVLQRTLYRAAKANPRRRFGVRRMDRRGYRDWPDQFLCRELGLYRLSGRLATRRSVECRTG